MSARASAATAAGVGRGDQELSGSAKARRYFAPAGGAVRAEAGVWSGYVPCAFRVVGLVIGLPISEAVVVELAQ